MKAMKCEMCNGTDIVKTDGLYVCQSCGTKYDPVEARKLIVEITGSVSVDGVATADNLMIRANEFFEKGDFEKATEYASRVLDIDASDEDARQLLEQIDEILNPKVKVYALGDVVISESQYYELMGQLETNKIQVIKTVREITGWGLKESKEYTEQVLMPAAGIIPEQPQSKGGCYVASAVYGSYDCSQVWVLRRYRDQFLANSALGRAFIRTYYAVSPTIVRYFGDSTWFSKLCRPALDALIQRCRARGYSDAPYQDRPW